MAFRFEPRAAPRLLLLVLLAWPLVAPSRSAQAAELPLPPVEEFARGLINGNPDQLRGAYAPSHFAFAVVQQPQGRAAYVSPLPNMLTQFKRASELGSIGLLAHNELAGSKFQDLSPGESVFLIHGDGSLHLYRVTDVYRYRALDPENINGDFLSPDGRRANAAAVFARMYGRPGALILQTCIAGEGSRAWGRLFVVAEPVAGGES